MSAATGAGIHFTFCLRKSKWLERAELTVVEKREPFEALRVLGHRAVKVHGNDAAHDRPTDGHLVQDAEDRTAVCNPRTTARTAPVDTMWARTRTILPTATGARV
jgi:hypothetical protein